MNKMPPANTLLYIAMCGKSFSARVENIDRNFLVITQPLGLDDGDIPEIGSVLSVYWSSVQIRYILPVQIVKIESSEPYCWWLRVVSEAVSQTRRRYPRAGGGTIEVIAIDGQILERPYVEKIVDISETAVRFPALDIRISIGGNIAIRAWLADNVIDISGFLKFVRPSHGGSGDDFIVAYHLAGPEIQAIKQHIAHWETAKWGVGSGR